MNRVEHRKGFTLVEMVITMTLLAIFFTSSIVVLGSFTRVYYRVQELNRALLIGDTILQSVEEQLKVATRINEIYSDPESTDSEHDQIILFTDSDGLYRLFDTRGDDHNVSGDLVETIEGQIWLSYYTVRPDLSTPLVDEEAVGIEQIMGSSFYRNNYIKLSFRPFIEPDSDIDGGMAKVQYMEITVEVWTANRMITETKGVIQMQYMPGIG